MNNEQPRAPTCLVTSVPPSIFPVASLPTSQLATIGTLHKEPFPTTPHLLGDQRAAQHLGRQPGRLVRLANVHAALQEMKRNMNACDQMACNKRWPVRVRSKMAKPLPADAAGRMALRLLSKPATTLACPSSRPGSRPRTCRPFVNLPRPRPPARICDLTTTCGSSSSRDPS